MDYFPAAFDLIVGAEGGYVNNPNDPGGETRFGISKRRYPQLDIANLTLDQAKAIYQRDYWFPLQCSAMPWDMALVVFDAGVNHGPGVARVILRTATTAEEFQSERALRYAMLPTFETFGRGWIRRLFHIFKAAQTLP